MHHGVRAHPGERSLDLRAISQLTLNEASVRIDSAPVAFGQIIEDGYFVALIQQQLGANAPDVTGTANNEDFHAPGKCGAIRLKSK